MCLTSNIKKNRILNKMERVNFKFYKIFFIKNKKLETPYTKTLVRTKKVKADGYLDIRVGNEDKSGLLYDKLFGIFGGAIHAFTLYNIAASKFPPFHFLEETIVLPIKVDSDQIIAFGLNNDVCFFEYEFTEESLNILKEKGVKLK